MHTVRHHAAVLLTAAALVTGGCTDDPEPAATIRVDVPAGDVTATAGALRSRLTVMGLAPGKPKVDDRTVTFGVKRAATPAEAEALARPGLLHVRRVTETLPPDGKAAGAPEGSCAETAYRARLAEASRGAAACAADGTAKYVLDAPEEFGGVGSVGLGEPGDVSTGEPTVNVQFKDAAAWERLTGRLAGQQLALVVDGVVMTAPTVQGPIPNGNATISGNFTEGEARLLAAVLSGGPLETRVEVRTG